MGYNSSECFMFKLKVYFCLQVAPAGSQGTQKYAVIKKTSQQPTTPSKSDSNAPWLPSSKDMQVNYILHFISNLCYLIYVAMDWEVLVIGEGEGGFICISTCA